jgi:ATP synthase protein I
MPKLTQEERRRIYRAAALLTQVAVGMIACVAIAIFLGFVLDNWLGTSPVFIIVFIFLGVAAAFKYLYDMAKRIG